MALHAHTDDDQDDDDLDTTGHDGDQGDADEQEEEQPAAPRRKAGGRPRSGTSLTATAVFKDEAEFQEFEQEASDRNLSISAYALEVLLNRGNTVEGAGDWKAERRRLTNRITQLEGAKEQLQAMYEAERARGGQGGGLSGLDTPAALTPKDIKKLVDEGMAEREKAAKLARLELVEKELADTKKELENLEDQYDNLQDEMERLSNFEAKVKTYAPVAVQGLLGQFPNLAKTIAGSPLGALAGLTPESVGIGAGATTTDHSNDPLLLALNRTRDNLSPKQLRDLDFVLDAIAKQPGYVTRFAQAIQEAPAAQRPAGPGQPAPNTPITD